MILVPLIDWTFLKAFAAGRAGASDRRHRRPSWRGRRQASWRAHERTLEIRRWWQTSSYGW